MACIQVEMMLECPGPSWHTVASCFQQNHSCFNPRWAIGDLAGNAGKATKQFCFLCHVFLVSGQIPLLYACLMQEECSLVIGAKKGSGRIKYLYTDVVSSPKPLHTCHVMLHQPSTYTCSFLNGHAAVRMIILEVSLSERTSITTPGWSQGSN